MTTYNKIEIDGLDIFYREAGQGNRPKLLLLHGFPASSFMFRELIPRLADQYRVIAPDLPGFGFTEVPVQRNYKYSFDALAQTLERGAVHGTVYDPTHATIPNAKVTLSNPSTGFRREMTTSSDGGYDFESVPPGQYTIVAEASGFAVTTITGIVVNVGASPTYDVNMPPKGAQEAVTVTAETAAVDTSTTGITQLLNSRSLENLPFPGRDYRDLAQLSSSAQVVPGLRGNIRLGGQQSDYTGLVIDGADTTNNFFGENFGSLETKNLTVPIEAVQEFQVVTNGFAPEFGRATGGLLNVVTKSGTNQLHGEAHEYYRGGGLTKDDALGNPPNLDWQHQFGGSVGFPIRKDRQFLFLSTDIQRNSGPLTTNLCHGDPICQNDAGPVIPVAANSSDRLGSACAGARGRRPRPAHPGRTRRRPRAAPRRSSGTTRSAGSPSRSGSRPAGGSARACPRTPPGRHAGS